MDKYNTIIKGSEIFYCEVLYHFLYVLKINKVEVKESKNLLKHFSVCRPKIIYR